MMITNKKSTFIIILLLVANLGLLAFMICKPHRGKFDENAPKNRIIKRLGFNDEQSETFSKLVDSHRKEVLVFDEKIITDKEHFFSILGESTPSTAKADSLASNIAGYQKEIEMLHFNHFKEVKALCKGEQIEKFNQLSKKFAKIFTQKRGKRPRKN